MQGSNDGPSDQHSEWIQKKVQAVQGTIITVPVIQVYEEAFKSVKRDGRVIAVALPKENLSISIPSLIIREIQLIGSMVGTRKDM